jgi:hypothetical protein
VQELKRNAHGRNRTGAAAFLKRVIAPILEGLERPSFRELAGTATL